MGKPKPLRTPFQVTYKTYELRELDRQIRSDVSAKDSSFSEMATAKEWGKLPHEWFAAPRWSRVIAMAVSSIQSKLDYLANADN